MSRVRLLCGVVLAASASLLSATDGAYTARLPGFAAELAQRPPQVDGNAWKAMPDKSAWLQLSTVEAAGRQSARWDYARSLIAQERGPDALGVLEVMRQDDPDLGMVDAWRLAHGAALTLVGRADAALTELGMPGLRINPEACLWRSRALAGEGLPEQALQQLECAAPALAKPRAAPFVLAAARAGIEGGAPQKALHWLSWLPDRDPAANLLRGRADLALGRHDAARLRLARVEQSGTAAQRMDARLSRIEGDVARKAMRPEEALGKLAEIRYSWRGDAIEERALRLSYSLADGRNDLAGALSAGAALVRYHDTQGAAALLPDVQAKLAAALDPERKLPLERAASLYWDYRDVAPSGAQGDLLVSRLAARLQQAGLYERAADLLSHQLMQRAGDLARGPLSARVASLYILAGRPERALRTLRETEDPGLPDSMVGDRKRVEAAALAQVGRAEEALAVLQDLPGSAPLQAEILWQRRDWGRYAQATGESLPKGKSLDAVAQAQVLRHAISQAMLGREDALAWLHSRYAAAFKGLPSAPVFEMLTGAPGAVDAAKLARAMAAIPSASPAGTFADLLGARKTP